MRRLRFNLIFGAVFVLAFAVCYWLLMAESSPFHSYLLWHVEPQNIWRRLHIGPYIAGMILSGNVHQPSLFGFLGAGALQWFIVGFLLSFVFTGFKIRHHENRA